MSSICIRQAVESDVPILRELIEASVRGLQVDDYTPAQLELALKRVYGVDSQLIKDGTYFVAQTAQRQVVGCGGWSQRKTLYGGDQFSGREDSLLDPKERCSEDSRFLCSSGVGATRHRDFDTGSL
jgi:hypothetical protein